MVHLIRHLLDFMSQKDCKAVVPMLSVICRGANAKPACRVWRTSKPATGPAIPGMTQSWRRDWHHVVPLRLSDCARHHLHGGCGRNVRGASVISKLRLIMVGQVAPDRYD
ncbi:transposase [Mesorhizobium amorphae]|uniref:transposase n=1 Tax=Mesorhizobium amorphae TaxID=71433 RepID=UPI003F505023